MIDYTRISTLRIEEAISIRSGKKMLVFYSTFFLAFSLRCVTYKHLKFILDKQYAQIVQSPANPSEITGDKLIITMRVI